MARSIRVVEFDDQEKTALSEISKVARADDVSRSVSAFIKGHLSSISALAKTPQADHTSVEAAVASLDAVTGLLDALPGDVAAGYRNELTETRTVLAEAAGMLTH